MAGNYKIRTDLALETTERFTEENVEVRGVEIQENYNEEKDIKTTTVRITTENGARTMGRPQGTYITIEAPGLSVHDEDYHREISGEIARHLRKLLHLEKEQSILVVGLGNSAITADSLGPHVVENLNITRHMIREYGLQSYGNLRDHTGNRGRNETRRIHCHRRTRSQKYQTPEPNHPDHRHWDQSGLRCGKPPHRTDRRKSPGKSNRNRSSHSRRRSHHRPRLHGSPAGSPG